MGKRSKIFGREKHWVHHESVKRIFSKVEPEKKDDESDVISHKTSFEINFNLRTVIIIILIIIGIALICSDMHCSMTIEKIEEIK